jgi:peptide/nickel transport system permease protein
MIFFLKRTTNMLFFLFAIVLINFTLLYLSPGDPANQYFNPNVQKENLNRLQTEMGTNQPYFTQLSNWLKNIINGNLGYSWSEHRPVSEILKEAIPATLQLTTLALFINIVLGLFLGAIMGMFPGRLFARMINYFTLVIYATPVFFLAIFFIYLFSFKLDLIPSSGMSSLYLENANFITLISDRLKHLLLPAGVLGLMGAAVSTRFFGSKLETVLQQQYILTAKAKGLPTSKILLVHAFRNAIIPVITLLGMYFPILLSGALIVEVIFAWPGMGRVTYEAIFAKDIPLLMAVNLIAAIMVVAGNFFADVTCQLVDPRMRTINRVN